MSIVSYEKILKALANKKRLQIIEYLNENEPKPVFSIAKAIKLSIKSTSKHLLILKNTDVLESEYMKHQNHYRLKRPLSIIVKTIM
ncbi:MAG: ArsR family transcriptional regulator [bacterium]